MRFTWTKRTDAANPTKPAMAQSQAASLPVAGPQFAAQDFVKLVGYAVASGVAFSALAIGVTLAVSRDSEAQTSAARWVAQGGMFVLAEDVQAPTANDVADAETPDAAAFEPESDLSPAPGSLYIGDGCGAEELAAIEREWYVSIDDGVATVQVMQTFVLPEQTERMVLSAGQAPLGHEDRDAESRAPSFSALLPSGAEFLHMTVDTSRGRLTAKQVAVAEDDLDYQTVQRLAREEQARGDLPVYLNQLDGAAFFSSAQVLDFRAGETIVVTYRYRIAIHQDNGRSQLTLPLQGVSEIDHDAASPVDFAAGSANYVANDAATGTVWVEWKNASLAPRVFDVLPRGATVEQRFEHGRNGIVGLNWATERIAPGEKFVLGWR